MIRNALEKLFFLAISGKQKAVVAFVVSSVLSGLAQVGVSGKMTVEEALTAVGTGIVSHAFVFLTANKD